MPIAAVPKYFGNDFKESTPAQRFGLLLATWTSRKDQQDEVTRRSQAQSPEGHRINQLLQRQGMDETIQMLCQENRLPKLWEKNDAGARQSWKQVTALTPGDQARIKALHDRQVALSGSYAGTQMLVMEALATAPFTTGLGNEHPLENGFAFLNPYGIPYLPGSGVKGVLRQAARELAGGKWGDTQGWHEERCYPLMETRDQSRKPVLDTHKNPIMLTMLDVLFGYESKDGETTHVRGVLSFWDVIPQIKGNSLSVEIMTPHQGHYYQQKTERNTGNSSNPHESGQPIPISFLTVPPGSGFTFNILCDTDHLNRLAPELAQNEAWKTLLTAAFAHAFQWLGFGAKTAVGYGAMKLDQDRIDEQNRIAREQQAKREKEVREASMTANQKAVDAFITECEKRKKESNGVKERQNTGMHQKAQQLIKQARESGTWTDSEKKSLFDAVKKYLSELTDKMDRDAFRKLKLSELSPS